MDECCRQHDMCCSPGGPDVPLTHLCNREMVDCINHCQTLWHELILDPEDVCRHVIWAAMDMVAGSWCCGRPCPTQVYVRDVVEMARTRAHALFHSVQSSLLHRVTSMLNGCT
jgi:hypothetical protein